MERMVRRDDKLNAVCIECVLYLGNINFFSDIGKEYFPTKLAQSVDILVGLLGGSNLSVSHRLVYLMWKPVVIHSNRVCHVVLPIAKLDCSVR